MKTPIVKSIIEIMEMCQIHELDAIKHYAEDLAYKKFVEQNGRSGIPIADERSLGDWQPCVLTLIEDPGFENYKH